MGQTQRPTRVRYLVVAACAAVAVVLYLDRVCLSMVGGYAREDLGLLPWQLDLILGAFFVTYAIGQVPAGWLADRFGARRMMAIYLLACAACMAGIASATGFIALLAFRLALGLAEAGGYPTAGGLLRRWVPATVRGRANSMVALGGRAGGATTQYTTALLLVLFAPLTVSSLLGPSGVLDPGRVNARLAAADLPPDSLAARVGQRLQGHPADADRVNALIADPGLTEGVALPPSLPRQAREVLAKRVENRTPAETERLNRLALEAEFPGAFRQIYGIGWRQTFLVYAGVGLTVAVLFWMLTRDRPEDHPWSNAAEAELVRSEGVPPANSDRGPHLLGLLARDRNLWLSGGCQFCLNFGWVFLITKMPDFLRDAYGVPLETRGVMAMIPLLAGVLGMLAGGFLADWLARTVSGRWSRALPWGLSPLIGAVAFAICATMPGPWATVAALGLVALATDLTMPTVWSFAQDITRRHVGAAMGWGNMWGNLGAAAAPLLLGAVRTWIAGPENPAGGWGPVFGLCAGAFVLAGAAGLFIDVRRPLDPSEQPAVR